MTENLNNKGCIIGIDFGTTYSGCCFCYLDYACLGDSPNIETTELETVKEMIRLKKKQVQDISDSERKRGKKTPTVAIYDRSMKLLHWGNAALNYAREGINDDEVLLQRFKLDLPTTFSQRGARQIFTNKEKNVIAQSLIATIDYYKILFAHAYDQIQRTKPLSDINFSKDNLRFIITVPAVWNDTQRAIMRDIVYQAGLISQFDDEKKLQIINESLASTLYCEHELREKIAFQGEEIKRKIDLQEGDIYITCDAGGGTVDIAAFVVTKSTENKTGLSRCQISADSGDKCGSIFIDRAMEELLMKVLYRPDIDHFSKEEKTKAKKSIALLMEHFAVKGKSGIKFNFKRAERTSNEENDESDNENDSDDQSSDDSRRSVTSQSSDDEEIVDNEYEENDNDVKFDITFSNPKITWKEKDQCVIDEDPMSGTKWLRIPFEKVAKEVFDEVIDKTIRLLDTQIEKIRNTDKIKATFLVGGLGNSPYLNQRIREYFNIGEGKFKCGMVINDEDGDMATMRGAVHYGIESAFGASEANIATSKSSEDPLYSVPGKFDTLICYDIGYDFTRCLVTNLSRDASFASKSPFCDSRQKIKTNNTITLEVGLKMQYSKILSLAKADLRALLVDHLKALLEYTIEYMHATKQCIDREQYRYCLTLENSYGFFNDKNEMKDIAIKAGLLGADEDARSRLLLIKREDAAALYLESHYFKNYTRTQSRLSHQKRNPLSVSMFLQLHVNSDNCHLLLYEATRIIGDGIEKYPRNVRCIRKTTFYFNYSHNVAMALKQYLTDNEECFQCGSGIHTRSQLEFDSGKITYSSNNEADDLGFSVNSMWKIRRAGQECCQITISGFYFLQTILKPVNNRLASIVANNAVQAGIMEYRLDNVFLVGKLLQISEYKYLQIENSFILRLSECLNLGEDLIVRADNSYQEVVKGALLYGLTPSIFMERIARRTYMVSFEAFTPRFTDEAIKNMKLTEDQDRKYDAEYKHVMAGGKAVNIYYQPAQSPSSKISVPPMDTIVLINRGDTIIRIWKHWDCKKSFLQRKMLSCTPLFILVKNQ